MEEVKMLLSFSFQHLATAEHNTQEQVAEINFYDFLSSLHLLLIRFKEKYLYL